MLLEKSQLTFDILRLTLNNGNFSASTVKNKEQTSCQSQLHNLQI